MFLLVSGHVSAQLDRHQHGVSIQISLNLVKIFLRISCLRWYDTPKYGDVQEKFHFFKITRFKTLEHLLKTF